MVYNWKLFWAFLEDWKENVKGSLLPCYNSSEGQPLDRIINSIVDEGDLSADCRWKGLSF